MPEVRAVPFGRSNYARRLAGFTGVAAGLLMFSGDMLFYGHWGSGAKFHEGMIATVRQASDQRLFVGGLIGPVAACLFIIGFWHVFLNVEPKAPISARVVFLCFAALMVGGGAVHALWTPYGLALKYCLARALHVPSYSELLGPTGIPPMALVRCPAIWVPSCSSC